MKKYIVTAAALLTVGLIAGCGGGDSSAPTSVSGKVADGYLVNATVFLDKNNNYQLDPGEPSTLTDGTGYYTLPVDPANMGDGHIVAMAIAGQTTDTDYGTTPITASYVLSMPASATSGAVGANFISPITSELREMMETGTYASMREAMAALAVKLGLPAETNLLEDYMLNNNTAMHTTMHNAAQNMATLMGGQMAQVMTGTSATTTTVDVNRYRAMMGTIFSNMSTVTRTGSQTMATLGNMMTTTLGTMPMMSGTQTQTYQNMSTAFRGGMMY